MAYMNQEKKAKIAAQLKTIMPKDWKWSLSVENHSTIVLTIQSAPFNLVGMVAEENLKRNPLDGWAVNQKELRHHMSLNPYYLETQFSGEMFETFTKIKAVLNTDNHDRSDSMTDYFDVGHYVSIQLGRWDKPFVNTMEMEAA